MVELCYNYHIIKKGAPALAPFYYINMSPALLGCLRALGVAVLMTILHFVSDAVHLAPIVGQAVASIIAALALAAEHSIESNGGGALFGAVKR